MLKSTGLAKMFAGRMFVTSALKKQRNFRSMIQLLFIGAVDNMHELTFH